VAHARPAVVKSCEVHRSLKKHEQVEFPVVQLAHAAPDPETVVVELVNALVALLAVLHSDRLVVVAL